MEEAFRRSLPHPSRQQVQALLAAPALKGPLRQCVQAEAQAAALMAGGGSSVEAVHRSLLSALDQVPNDTPVWAWMMAETLRFLRWMGDWPGVITLLDHLETVDVSDLGPGFQVIAPRQRFDLGMAQRDATLIERALDVVEQRLGHQPDADAYLEFRYRRLMYLGGFQHFAEFEQQMALDDPRLRAAEGRLGVRLVALEFGFYLTIGEPDRARDLLDQFPDPRHHRLQCLRLAVYEQHYDRAHGLIELMLKDGLEPVMQREVLMSAFRCALLSDDLALAHRYLALLEAKHALLPGQQRELGLLIALRMGNRSQARDILEQLDPQAATGDLLVPWMRLLVQEGQLPKAGSLLRRALSRGRPRALLFPLAFAKELPPDRLSALWLEIQSPETPVSALVLKRTPAKTIAPSQPQIIAQQVIGSSAAMHTLRQEVAALAQRRETILLTAETGCGKEVVAQLLHQVSPQSKQPFVVVNCGALPASLAEAELFGHSKGAFTGAERAREGAFTRAAEGTLFLGDECW